MMYLLVKKEHFVFWGGILTFFLCVCVGGVLSDYDHLHDAILLVRGWSKPTAVFLLFCFCKKKNSNFDKWCTATDMIFESCIGETLAIVLSIVKSKKQYCVTSRTVCHSPVQPLEKYLYV